MRCYSYISLHQNIQNSDGLRRENCESQPAHSNDTPRSVDATQPRSSRLRGLKRAPQLSSEDDSTLEALFSSQLAQQRVNSETRYSKTPFIRTENQPEHPRIRETAELQSSRTTSDQADHHTRVADRLDQIIAGLQQQEKQIADLIAETRLLYGSIKAPAPPNKLKITFPNAKGQIGEWDDTAKARRVTTLIKNLARATDRYDVAWVAQLWQKYQQSPDCTQLDRSSREILYVHFLSAFFELSRQEQAIQVWNHMLQSDTTPNERHWNAMLKGCSKARDFASLQEVWSNMVSTGIEPDQILWTTYIHGLIMCGQWNSGLRALDNLGARWNAAKKRKASKLRNSTTTRHSQPIPPEKKYDPNIPSLAPVQGAITALTVVQRHALCFPLLTWATSHSIPLTTEVFNILLRPAVRTSDTPRIQKIFSLMHAHNCPADEATYTILLDGHISSSSSSTRSGFSNLSPTEQKDSILKILDDMTAHGISIDKRTYGTILRTLLSPERGVSNDDAVRAVLAHMSKNNVLPDSYIYHMLITHHFSLSPPDIPAVEAIWSRIKVERPNLQSVFYEKMVVGYASVRAVERMMFFLRRIVQEGNSPRWGCLVVVLRSLVELQEWELVRELVDDVEDVGVGLMRYADANVASISKDEFWGVVERLELEREWREFNKGYVNKVV